MTSSAVTPPVLELRNLVVEFVNRHGTLRALDGISLSIAPGEVLGVVGESGAGKSLTGAAVIGLLEPPGRIASGEVLLAGQRIDQLPVEELRHIRGKRIGTIFQDPLTSLDPLYRVGEQLIETIRTHLPVSEQQARERAIALLAEVGIPAPEKRIDGYPHEFSGGMRQRVVIAIALLNKPDLIICDEPTTALDVTIQGQILYEMQKLCAETGAALIWITHDLSVIAGLADTVSVMYAGKIVESGTAKQVLEQPRHPYSHALIASAPSRNPRGQPLRQIPGMTPSLIRLPSGCAFRERCDRVSDLCRQAPPMHTGDGRMLRCFHPVGAEYPEVSR